MRQVVGMLVCGFGLCSGLFTQIMRGFFPQINNDGVSDFLQDVGIIIAVVGAITTTLQDITPREDGEARPIAESKRVNAGMLS